MDQIVSMEELREDPWVNDLDKVMQSIDENLKTLQGVANGSNPNQDLHLLVIVACYFLKTAKANVELARAEVVS